MRQYNINTSSKVTDLKGRVLRNLSYIVLIGILSACGSVSNPGVAINNLQTQQGISKTQADSIFSTLIYYPNQTQLSIAFFDDQSATFYGAIRTNDTVRTIDNKGSVFEIGSLSKVFTSTLLADLTHNNKVQLDQSIQNYLDFPLNDSLQITFRELANHSSGLPRIPSGFLWESLWHMDNPYKDYDKEKLRDYMKSEIKLENNKGTFQYSNIGAGILGYVLTQVEDQTFEEMLQQKIFLPLNMRQSTTNRALVTEKLVVGLTKRGNYATNWDLGAIPGAGAILSTSEDLVKYGQANFNPNNEIMNLQQQRTFNVNNKMDLALGWFILEEDSTTKWYSHNGGTGGYRSSMVLDIDRKKGVIVLSNISAGHSHAAKIDSLSYSLLREMSRRFN